MASGKVPCRSPGQWGRGYPPPAPAHGWRGDPLRKNKWRGGRGITPLPPCPRNGSFSARPKPVFRVEPRREQQIDRVIIFGEGGSIRAGGGRGTPHLLRHMGGGVTPSGKINGGGVGGSPPSPPLVLRRPVFRMCFCGILHAAINGQKVLQNCFFGGVWGLTKKTIARSKTRKGIILPQSTMNKIIHYPL